MDENYKTNTETETKSGRKSDLPKCFSVSMRLMGTNLKLEKPKKLYQQFRTHCSISNSFVHRLLLLLFFYLADVVIYEHSNWKLVRVILHLLACGHLFVYIVYSHVY